MFKTSKDQAGPSKRVTGALHTRCGALGQGGEAISLKVIHLVRRGGIEARASRFLSTPQGKAPLLVRAILSSEMRLHLPKQYRILVFF